MPKRNCCTRGVIEKIAGLVEMGASLRVAAQAVGIAPKTLSNWLSLGRRQSRGRYRDLVDAIEQARERLYLRALRTISEAVDAGDVRTARWLLERLDPERFAPRQVIDLLADERTLRRLPDDELEALARELGIYTPDNGAEDLIQE